MVRGAILRSTVTPHARAAAATAVLAAIAVAILFAMDRPPICTCGYVELWHPQVQSSGNSQHVADWYSPSHFTHGLIMYALAWLLWTKWNVLGGAPARLALPIAVAVEAAWEVTENSPMIIDRYRAVTVSFGYSGDTILNSACDIAFMALGFLFAARVPVWVSVATAIGFEILTLLIIRDNLTLNVVMLFWPIEAIRQWQAG